MHTLPLEEEQPWRMSCSVIMCAGVALRFLGQVIYKWNCYKSFPSEQKSFLFENDGNNSNGHQRAGSSGVGFTMSSHGGIVIAAGHLSSL